MVEIGAKEVVGRSATRYLWRSDFGPMDRTFLGSSMVEHAAVNRRVVGSSPTRGAIRFYGFRGNDAREPEENGLYPRRLMILWE